MGDVLVGALIFAGVGIVFVCLGIPLYYQRVPPNPWYGCRTIKSLSDEKIWYAVNRVTGHGLIVAGIALIISSLGLLVFVRRINGTLATGILLGVLLLSLTGMVLRSAKVLRRL